MSDVTTVLCGIFGTLIVGVLFIVDELRQIKAILLDLPPAERPGVENTGDGQ